MRVYQKAALYMVVYNIVTGSYEYCNTTFQRSVYINGQYAYGFVELLLVYIYNVLFDGKFDMRLIGSKFETSTHAQIFCKYYQQMYPQICYFYGSAKEHNADIKMLIPKLYAILNKSSIFNPAR
jgi:hypothetical protein